VITMFLAPVLYCWVKEKRLKNAGFPLGQSA